MKSKHPYIISIGLLLGVFAFPIFPQTSSTEIVYHCLNKYPVLGKGWHETAATFHRLPLKWQSRVTESVWRLASNSAGLMLAFESNAPALKVRWHTLTNNHMPHMTDVATKGLDLYAWSNSDNLWRWVGCTKSYQPGPTFTADLVTDMDSSTKTFLLYLPLYDGIDSIWIGIASWAFIRPINNPFAGKKPLVFYGTSITQGGCASRPGMSYPAIIGRQLNWPCVNLGFSGAGKMELPMANLLAEIDAAIYIIDCLPNMTPEMVTERFIPFIETLRRLRPQTPIVLVPSFQYENSWLKPNLRETLAAKNAALRDVCQKLLEQDQKIILIPESELGDLGTDATVDGVHFTDVGFLRLAKVLIPYLKSLLQV